MHKIKGCFIVSTLQTKGPTKQLLYIIKYLDRHKFEPVVLTLSPEPENTDISLFQDEKVEIHSLNLSRVKGFLEGAKCLKKTINTIKPDIVHSQGIRADAMVLKNLKNLQTVNTVRNYPYEDYPDNYGKLIGVGMAGYHMNIFKKARNPVACSFTLGNKLEKATNRSFNVIQNGVDQAYYLPVSFSEKEEIRSFLKLTKYNKVFIMVGQLIKRKDPFTLIDGFTSSSFSKDSALLVIGDGPLLEECKQKYVDYPNILFWGNKSNVLDFLHASDFFISASLSEGLPNAVLEALACGIPVCLSDIDQHKEILQYNLDAGVMFKTGSKTELMENIEALAKKDYKGSSDAALSIINDHLNAKMMSERYQELYIDLTDNNPG